MSESEHDAAQVQQANTTEAEPAVTSENAAAQNTPDDPGADAQNMTAKDADESPEDASAAQNKILTDGLPPVTVDQTPEIFEETRATEAWGKRRNRERDLRRLQRRAYLVVRRESTVGAHIEMDQDKLVMGRDPDSCDIVLSGDGVSRIHARIERNTMGYYALVDNNSRNGVYVDGRLIERMNLVDGDVFEIGHNILEFHIKDK